VSGLTANGLVFDSLEAALAGKVLDPS
jgi:hypothetical protein